jgi:hypothetical protein
MLYTELKDIHFVQKGFHRTLTGKGLLQESTTRGSPPASAFVRMP